MANGHGGYRKPRNPAPVSGPGALSRRTDGGPGSKQAIKEIRTGKYGESKAVNEMQAAAPMAGSPAPSVQPKVSPLFAKTQRPSEPVTDGMPFGPGKNSLGPTTAPAVQGGAKAFPMASALQPLLDYDMTGNIKKLYEIAVQRGW